MDVSFFFLKVCEFFFFFLYNLQLSNYFDGRLHAIQKEKNKQWNKREIPGIYFFKNNERNFATNYMFFLLKQ
jgi:hypothetical protein